MHNIQPKNVIFPAARRSKFRGSSSLAVVLALSCTFIDSAPAQNAAPPVAADDQANAGLESIIVTANKRGNERLRDVPTAIQAIGGDTLARIGAVEFADYAGRISGLQFQDLGPGDKKYIIRGINSSGAGTVGVYYDEAVITGANADDGGGRNPDIRLYDLERIEVLKGPQGTLYGAGSLSGTIRFVTKKPKLDAFEGYVNGDVSGTFGGGVNYKINGALNLPIVTDKLAVRAVGWLDDNSGFIDQPRIQSGGLKNVNYDDTLGGRINLKFKPIDDLTLGATVTAQRMRVGGSSRYTPPGVTSFGDAGAGFPPVTGGDLINTDLTVSPWNENLQVYGATAEYSAPFGTFTATTNYYQRAIDFSFDSSPILFFFGVPIPGITLEPQNRNIWSNEIRFASKFAGPLNFVVGGFLQRERSNLTVQVVRSTTAGLPRGPFSPLNADDALSNPDGNTFFGRTDHRSLDQEALFGELSYKPIEGLTATFGIRFFEARLVGIQETTHPFGGFTSSPIGPQSNTGGFNNITYKGNISYKINKDFLVYFNAQSGFRIGGLNAANLPFTSEIPRTFRPDSLWSYEIGLKGSALERRLNFDIAAYAIRWNDIQVAAVDSTGAFPFITNAGKASVEGVELSFDARPIEQFTITFAGSWQNSRLTQNQPRPNIGRAGDPINNVPDFQGQLSSEYRQSLTSDFEGSVRADVTYRGSTRTTISPDDPFRVDLAEYATVDLRASAESKLWTVSLYVRNLIDARAQVDAILSQQDPLARLTVRPRTAGISLTRRF